MVERVDKIPRMNAWIRNSVAKVIGVYHIGNKDHGVNVLAEVDCLMTPSISFTADINAFLVC